MVGIAAGSFAQNPLPNAGFENWTQFAGGFGSTYREPNGWNSSNQCSSLIANYSVTRTEDSHSGQYAAQLRTRSAFGNIFINGLLSTSEVVCGDNTGGIRGGVPSGTIPDSVAFWYKYSPEGNDTAYVQVILLAGGDTLSYAKGRLFEQKTDWTRASFAIPAPTGTPDTISTLFNSSWGDGSQGQAVVNSTFIVDDVEFVIATSIGEQHKGAQWEVYPNPVRDILNIRGTELPAMLEMLDATGRTVMTQHMDGMRSTVDVSTLPPGLYLYRISGPQGKVMRTGKVLRSN